MLQGRMALVVGGASGIGRAIAAAYVGCGAAVVVADRAAVDPAESGAVGAVRVDVTDDGAGTGAGTPGFGLVGMRERVRSVGGMLDAGPLDDGAGIAGFAVHAVLPLRAHGEGAR